MIALVMMKMSLISMSIFVECIEFASTHQIQEISCVPNTPNTMANCIGALVRQRDGDTSVILMVEIYFYNLNK